MTFDEAVAEWTKKERRKSGSLESFDPAEFLNSFTVDKIDEWVERERAHRKGYYHGLLFAIDAVIKLKRAGFLRPQEIANILYEHCESKVRPWWRKAGYPDEVLKGDYRCNEPNLIVDSWASIRRTVIKRDQVCVACGNSDRLEVDHIEPVCEGGLPVPENLQLLCQQCHDSK
jgi:hypothetical protein